MAGTSQQQQQEQQQMTLNDERRGSAAASSASILHAASSLAQQASASTAGLQAVSDTFLTQAQQASQHPTTAAAAAAAAAQYSAAMTFRTAQQALKAQTQIDPAPPSSSSLRSLSIDGSGPAAAAAAAAAANLEIGSIAARAAAREAEAQLLVHEMLRSSSAGAVVAHAAAAVATGSTSTSSAQFANFSFGAGAASSAAGGGVSGSAPGGSNASSFPAALPPHLNHVSASGSPGFSPALSPSTHASLAIPGGLAARRASANAAALNADLGYFAAGSSAAAARGASVGSGTGSPAVASASSGGAGPPAQQPPSSNTVPFSNLTVGKGLGLARSNSTASNRSAGGISSASHGSEGSAGSGSKNAVPQPPPVESYLASLGLSQVVLPSNNLIREQAERQMRDLKIASEGGHFANADGSMGAGPGITRNSAIAAVLGGVPSMPLMPTPPLQMLPPPPSPGFARSNSTRSGTPGGMSSLGTPLALVQQATRDGGFPFHTSGNPVATSAGSGSTASHRRSRPPTPGSATGTASGATSSVSGIPAMAPLAAGGGASAAAFAQVIGQNHTLTGQPRSPFIYPYPFQVVQTPGGTARAGWWIPKDKVPEERRKKARTVPGTLTSLGLGDDGRAGAMGSVKEEGEEEEEADQPPTDGQGEVMDDEEPYFQPSFRIFTPEEYSALASAAAYATAALTSTRSGPPRTTSREDTDESEEDEGETTDWKPLDIEQQEAIADQLRAWAGLEGPERQKEARAALGERKAQIFTQAVGGIAESMAHTPVDTDGDSTAAASMTSVDAKLATLDNPADAVKEPALATEFWPSDFASHYRAQLRALAEGYYVKVHEEALSKVDSSPPVGDEEDEKARSAVQAREGRRKRRSRLAPVVSSSEKSAAIGQEAAAQLADEVMMEGIESAPAAEVRSTSSAAPFPPHLQSTAGGRETAEEDRRRHLQQKHRQRKSIPDETSPARKAPESPPKTVDLSQRYQQPQPGDPSLPGVAPEINDALQQQERERLHQAQAATMALRDFERRQSEGVAITPELGALLQQQQQEQQQQQAAAVAGQTQDLHSASSAHDPIQLISAASNAAGVDIRSPALRDQLLQYAHSLYSNGTAAQQQQQSQPDSQSKVAAPVSGTTASSLHPSLLPLLHTLHDLHPQHLPTLLLMSCVYYSIGNLAGSLWYNKMILSIDPGYVEAMSNIGTTLRALGKWKDAEAWWWKAVKLRPGYWDAYENLLGVLCSPQQSPSVAGGHEMQNGKGGHSTGPRFQEALQLCELVENYITSRRSGGHQQAGGPGSPQRGRSAVQAMPSRLPASQACRLQNLFYAKGNLKYVLPEFGTVPAAQEYQRAVELMLSPTEAAARSLRDLVVSACVVGLLSLGASIPGPAGATAPAEIAAALGLNLSIPQHAALVASGSYSSIIPGGILRLVRQSGSNVVNVLLRLGGGSQLPFVLLSPEAAIGVGKCLLAETNGVLPSLLINSNGQPAPAYNNQAQVIQQAAQTTSTILLTLAKLYQDSTSNPKPGVHGPLQMDGITPSLSLLLPLYYLSLSLHPSASTFNNLGILLSSLPVVTTIVDPATGNRQQLNGQGLAMQYYTHGLQLDPHHPHIYTNTGSLLKDLGHLNEAIAMYQKAIECNPNFDVALANLGNAIKDSGRTQESIIYYRRAVEVNPDFPEALCGLVNALLAVCDWREVYSEDPKVPRWMSRVSDLVTKQLSEGALYGAGAMQAEGRLQDWVDMIIRLTADNRPENRHNLTQQLAPFFSPLDRAAHNINEGSFVIRLIERLMRSSQRKWYHDRHGKVVAYPEGAAQPHPFARVTKKEAQLYARPLLPASLVTPAVPTVLPFHTFTYPLSARQIRLISHRNAIRISQATLSQYWLPPHVYPPPAPPSPRINIGYVSSDLNNHPLAHLMQSVFGFHDRSRFNVFMYATTPSDQSPYRQKIESESEHFLDVSSWSNQQVVERILQDGIHVLMNLNGYTKGARNEIFAARPCPVQMEFMGFAGGLASSWTDWVVVDPIVCPPEMTCVDLWRARRRQAMASGIPIPDEARPTNFGSDLDPEEVSDDWVYTERFIYMPHSYFVNDHAQGFREPPRRKGPDGQEVQPHKMTPEQAWEEEEQRRWLERKELFPDLPDDFIIFTDFNQLYKCEPMLFKLWLRILARVKKSILWLLRFPAAAESHLLLAARRWAGDEVASRIVFTDVAPKHIHIHRGRIADLFLDTTECNAHTTAADILWSATPVLTWPRHQHKMCSRVAASIVKATGYGAQMIVGSEQEYEDRAVQLALELQHEYIDANGNVQAPVERPSGLTAACLVVNSAAPTAQPHGTSGAAPVNPASAAPASSATTVPTVTPEVAEASPDRSSILLEPGLSAPPGTVTRRGVGELAELRRKLFMTRDKNALFDTRAWTRALERGYEEAWRRWVEATDTEGPEWEALDESAPEKQSGHIWVTQDRPQV
ncbi:hypothetical protein OC846_002447 [Tilletia horrida]|uniref:protein O-GlcNAc transferase n=1 Tax=Tilletia horrida TaxID=155126 RepID=A0AAN6GQP9_9BASI|nr:hypothetical protein OC846_002447 [Tilletia horrida]KAK0567544.1 hypothetical protein OC861_002665 [Tilletia horrida]